jgi:CBS domain-containing protein
MKILAEILKDKKLHFVTEGQSVFSVINFMAENNVGAVPVLKDGHLTGIFSERDLLKRCVVKKLDLENTKIEDVMTKNVIIIESKETYQDCLQIMKQESIRHIPVRDGDKLIGLISMRDLLLLEIEDKKKSIEMLNSYINYNPDIS